MKKYIEHDGHYDLIDGETGHWIMQGMQGCDLLRESWPDGTEVWPAGEENFDGDPIDTLGNPVDMAD